MVESITLGASQRQTLFERTRIADARQQSSFRLSTGRKVNDIKDSPRAFLLAKSLLDRASSLLEAKSNISRGIDTLLATQNGLNAAQKFAEQLKGIAISAQSANAGDLANLSKQFDTARTQLNNLVGDVSFLGTNLLSSPAGTLNVNLSDNPSATLTVAGQPSDAASLGVGTAATTYNNFASSSDISAAITATESAISSIQSRGSSIVSNAAILNTREQFNQDMANTLQSGAAKMITADLNKEGAKLMSANVRDALSVQGQRIAAESSRLIVDLVRNS